MESDFSFRKLLKGPFRLDLVWLIFPASIIALGMAFMPVRSWDYWWHLSFGRLINKTHEMPEQAYFLYTIPAETTSYVQAWISQWALFVLHDSISVYGMLMLRNGIAAAAFLLLTLWAAKRARSAMAGSMLALCVIPFGFFIIALRSHLLAWPLIFLALPLAYRVRDGRWPVWALAFLPILTVGWVNLHGTFLVPFLISLSFFADSVLNFFLRKEAFKKELLLGFGLSSLFSFGATFLNPRGAEVYVYLLDLPTNTVNLSSVTEWFPTTLFFPVFYGPLFWVLLIGAVILFFKSRKTLVFVDLVLLLGFSILAMRHCRALMWFFLVFPITVAPYLGDMFKKTEEDVPSPMMSMVNILTVVALVGSAILVQPFGKFQWDMSRDAQVQPVMSDGPMQSAVLEDFPVKMVEIVKGIDPNARVFHDHRYSGYLIYALQSATPKQTVFVDNRIELSSPAMWSLLDEVSAGKKVDQTLDKYEVRFVLIRKESQQGLLANLRSNSKWEKRGEDAFNALFERR